MFIPFYIFYLNVIFQYICYVDFCYPSSNYFTQQYIWTYAKDSLDGVKNKVIILLLLRRSVVTLFKLATTGHAET